MVSFRLGAIISASAYLAINWLGWPTFLERSRPFNILLLTIPISFVFGPLLGPVLASGDVKKFYRSRTLQQIVYLALIVLISSQLSLSAELVAICITASAGVALVYCAIVFRRLVAPGRRVSWSGLRRVASYSGICNLSGLPYHLNNKIDQLYIGASLGPEALGQYAVAVTWSALLGLAASGLGTALVVTTLALQQSEGSKEIWSRRCRWAFYVLLLFSVGLGVSGYFLIPLIFGPAFHSASVFVVALCGVGLVNNLRLWTCEIARVAGHAKDAIYSEGIALVVILAFLPHAVRSFGIWGAIVTIFMGGTIGLAAMLVLLKRRLDFQLLDLVRLNVSDLKIFWQEARRLAGLRSGGHYR